MSVLALALVLAAAPVAAPVALAEIPSPLGHVGNNIEPMPTGSLHNEDKPFVAKVEGCGDQVVYLMRVLGGTARAVEQLQKWLEGTPDLETKVFGKKGQLGGVVRLLADSKLEPKRSCTPLALKNGYELDIDGPPKKFCPVDSKSPASLGDSWFFNKGHASAVVNVSSGEPDACKLRVSTVLFDARGIARVRFHADWAGAVSATLIGEKCQVVDFAFNSETTTFVPTLKSCKR